MDERQPPGSEDYEALPAEEVTIDQVIAWNMRFWRRASNMTQEELGEQIGWSAGNVSAAERSVEEHRDRRRFDAQTTAELAEALCLPVIALYLPPDDDGIGKRYVWRRAGDGPRDMAALMQIAMHNNDYPGQVMDEYRDRFRGAVTAYLEEKWAEEVGGWFDPMGDDEARAEQASRFRARQAQLLAAAAEQEALAEFLERPRGKQP